MARVPIELLGWRIWYTGGVLFSSRERNPNWRDLPPIGVLGVRLYFNDGSIRGHSGYTRYYKAGDMFDSSDRPLGEIRRRYPGAVILIGKQDPDEEWGEIELRFDDFSEW